MPATSKATPVVWTRRLGEHLETARTRARLSRAQLAQQLGVAEESVRRWERGGARPSPDSLARLLVILSLDAARFSDSEALDDELPPVAARLREERSRRGITQAQAGQELAVAQTTYAGWEIGRATPGTHLAARLAMFLGTPERNVRELLDVPFVVDTTGWSALGRIIGERRQGRRLTRQELGRQLGVSPATVTAWELGHRVPRPHQFPAIAAAIGVRVEWLETAIPSPAANIPALGRLVQARQRRLGLRQRDVADRVGVDESTLSRWVHGVQRPDQEQMKRLAAALEVRVPELLRAAAT